METIRRAEQCVQADMIAWVSYPAYSSRICLVYPRYLFDSYEWRAIDPNAFPNNGAILGLLRGGVQPSEIQNEYGSIVVARANVDHFNENYSYDSERDNSSFYALPFNPTFSRGSSELEFEAFSEHSMSTNLVQIVGIKDTISLMKPFDTPVTIDGNTADLVCRFILVRNASGKFFGPFEYARRDDRSIGLAAPSVNDYRVARLGSLKSGSILSIRDEYGITQCEFVEKLIVDEMLAAVDEEEKLDWMPQAELIDVITRAINASDEFNDLSKTQLRSIKAAIRNFNDSTGQLKLDENRKQRIVNWLSQIDNWAELPSQIVSEVMDSIADEKILDLVLDEKHYPMFKDKLIESAGVQERIAEERRKLEKSLQDIKRQCEEAEEERAIAEHEAQEAKSKAAEAQEQLEKVRDEALVVS